MKFEFDTEHTDVLLEGLGELKLKAALPTYMLLAQQIREQAQAMNPAPEPDEPDPEPESEPEPEQPVPAKWEAAEGRIPAAWPRHGRAL